MRVELRLEMPGGAAVARAFAEPAERAGPDARKLQRMSSPASLLPSCTIKHAARATGSYARVELAQPRSRMCATRRCRDHRSAAWCRLRAGSTRPGWRGLRAPRRSGSRRLPLCCVPSSPWTMASIPTARQPAVEAELAARSGAELELLSAALNDEAIRSCLGSAVGCDVALLPRPARSPPLENC